MDNGSFHVSFDPRSKTDRDAVKRLIEVYERAEDAAHVKQFSEPSEPVGPMDTTSYESHIREIIDLSCGKLLGTAIQHFGPSEQFDMKELATKSRIALDKILSWNRTLGNSCRARKIKKQHILMEHGGNPKKFSIPPPVYDSIRRIVSEASR
jgi:hypothetical protein